MKVAFVTNTCWNIYNFRKGLVHHLLQAGHLVVALAPKDAYTHKIVEWGVTYCEVDLSQTGTNPLSDLNYLLGLYRKVKAAQPDIMLSFTIKSNIYACLVGKVLGIPVVCNVSGLGTVFLVKGWSGRIALMLYRIAFRYAAHVFFQNQDDQKLFLEYVTLRPDKIRLVPGSGIDLAAFHYAVPTFGTENRLLMIARLIEEKGVREYVEAARSIKEEGLPITFTLVGRLDEKHSRSISENELDQWVKEGLVNYIPHTDKIMQLISEHDVIVLPSYREGTPRTLLEGGAMGRVLLATDVPGCREVVKDGYNGFLFELKSAKSLAQKIKLFQALSIDEKMTMSGNSRLLIESRFDEKVVIDRYLRTIDLLVDN